MAKPPADISMSYTRVVPERGLPTTNTGIRLRAEMLRVTVFSTAQRELALLSRAAAGKWSPRSASSSFSRLGPHARRPEIRGDLLLHRNEELSNVRTNPPALSTRAAPAATSPSCFGVRVNVASARPADTKASL